MSYLNLLRLGEVKRWHTIETAGAQTVADHSFRVAVIAMELAHRLGIIIDADFITYAIFHDAGEDRIGDPPSPLGAWSEVAKAALSDVQRRLANVDINSVYHERGGVSQTCQMIVKLADMMEAAVWLQSHAVGKYSEECAFTLTQKLFMAAGQSGMGAEGVVETMMKEITSGPMMPDWRASDLERLREIEP